MRLLLISCLIFVASMAQTEFAVVGDGWCRPGGCILSSSLCRVNGYYTDFSEEAQCRDDCLEKMHKCIGFAISNSNYDFPNRCYIYGDFWNHETPAGWVTYSYAYTDIGTSTGVDNIKCFERIIYMDPTVQPTLPDNCKDWCFDSPYEDRCTFENCQGCFTCSPTFEPSFSPTSPTLEPNTDPTPECPEWCFTNPPEDICMWPRCYPCVSCEPTAHPTWEGMQPTQNPSVSPTGCPTHFPTTEPTTNPSDVPSQEPSVVPTGDPTPPPTKIPTTPPTYVPSRNPTRNPSSSPTKEPSYKPTFEPTVSPTSFPTKVPTRSPIDCPTLHPTSQPTMQPTICPNWCFNTGAEEACLWPKCFLCITCPPTSTPSSTPTKPPSIAPTIAPTKHPTSQPVPSPTLAPTSKPSHHPTSQPTIQPTICPNWCFNAGAEEACLWPKCFLCITCPPTREPSTPSSTPTKPPTIVPTIAPTKHPTSQPVPSPTLAPTSKPSHHPLEDDQICPYWCWNSPTWEACQWPKCMECIECPETTTPTFNPTEAPTLKPSTHPTQNPTAHPTVMPSQFPSCIPTKTPSRFPTFPPTLNPSTKPSTNPTNKPSINPTHRPTANPSLLPSIHPTMSPTLTPSQDPTQSVCREWCDDTEWDAKCSFWQCAGCYTCAPTSSPTGPTLEPTLLPTYAPMTPTLYPSKMPTINPTFAPTLDLSLCADWCLENTSPDTCSLWQCVGCFTCAPTVEPTPSPTSWPTLFPTSQPSKHPTFYPTNSPLVRTCKLANTEPVGFKYTTGHNITDCTSSACDSPNIVGVVCNIELGYDGNVQAIRCTQTDPYVILHGCLRPDECSQIYDGDEAGLPASCACVGGSDDVNPIPRDNEKFHNGCRQCADNANCALCHTGFKLVDGRCVAQDRCNLPPNPPVGYTYSGSSYTECFGAMCSSYRTYGVACDNGYTGSPVVRITDGVACTLEEPVVTLLGCCLESAVTCELPSTIPTGYIFSSYASLSDCTSDCCSTPSITGVICDTDLGYYAIPKISVAPCAEDDSLATLTGCIHIATSNQGIIFEKASESEACCEQESRSITPSETGLENRWPLLQNGGTCAGGHKKTFQEWLDFVQPNGFSGICIHGQAYQLPNTTRCTIPEVPPPGYVYSASSTVNDCTSADCSTPALVGTICDSGYIGTPFAEPQSCMYGQNTPVSLSGCDSFCTDVTITISTRVNANENSWYISDDCQSSTTYRNYRIYQEQCCLPVEHITVLCYDSGQDGWDSGYIEIDGVRYCDRTDAWSFTSHVVGIKTDCKLPPSAPAGYMYDTITSIRECTNRECSDPIITGVSCDSSLGLEGQADTTKCIGENYFYVNLAGCEPKNCILPVRPPEGYQFISETRLTECTTASCSTGDAIVTGIACHVSSGYSGFVEVSGCTLTSRTTTLGGCAPTPLYLPSQPPRGYQYASEHLLDCTTVDCTEPDISGVSCDTSSGFGGSTITISGYEESNDRFEVLLAGCVPTICILPAKAPHKFGYGLFPSLRSCTSHECSSPEFQDIQCNSTAGFAGTIEVIKCQVGFPLVSLSGCDSHTCILPDVAPQGYLYSSPPPSLTDCTSETCSNPQLEGVVCANNYDGTVSLHPCTTISPYANFTGCRSVTSSASKSSTIFDTENAHYYYWFFGFAICICLACILVACVACKRDKPSKQKELEGDEETITKPIVFKKGSGKSPTQKSGFITKNKTNKDPLIELAISTPRVPPSEKPRDDERETPQNIFYPPPPRHPPPPQRYGYASEKNLQPLPTPRQSASKHTRSGRHEYRTTKAPLRDQPRHGHSYKYKSKYSQSVLGSEIHE